MRRVFGAALLAGIAAGLLVSLLRELQVVPLIDAAEAFEAAGPAHAHEGGRRLLTWAANLVAACGFGLLLCGAFALRGREPDWREGLLWGLAGFAAFSLAPALGLPPELPGMAAAGLEARQLWWAATAAATAAGLGLLAFARPVLKPAGVVLLLLPHLVGAPRPPGSGTVPPEIAAQFAVASLATALLFWAVLGALAGHLYRRL